MIIFDSFMNDTINLTIQGETFNVPREIVAKMGLLKHMLEAEKLNIQNEDTEITNIDPATFRIVLISLMHPEIDMLYRVADAYNFLDIHEKTTLMKDFSCKYSGCTGISLQKSYCPLHKCIAPSCNNPKHSLHILYDHCKSHICYYPNCNNIACPNFSYCVQHKCDIHKCDSPKSRSTKKYCHRHSCENLDCYEPVIPGYRLCSNHKCGVDRCYDAKCDELNWCKYHKCTISCCNCYACYNYNGTRYCAGHVHIYGCK
jgi:hypothetical protein